MLKSRRAGLARFGREAPELPSRRQGSAPSCFSRSSTSRRGNESVTNSGSLNWVELVGYLASLLVFSTFYMKTMIPLRCVAIASNVAFLTYGYFAGLYPVFLLHVVLLPLNLFMVRTIIRPS